MRHAKPASESALNALTTWFRQHGGVCVVHPWYFTASMFSASTSDPGVDLSGQLVVELLLECVFRHKPDRPRFQTVYFLLSDDDEPSACWFHAVALARRFGADQPAWVQSDTLPQEGYRIDMGVIPDDAYLYCLARAAGARHGWRWWAEGVT